jgi:hypothetical protein
VPDDPRKQAQDCQSVSIHDNGEADFWTALGISKERLEQAGNDDRDRGDDLRRALGKHHG